MKVAIIHYRLVNMGGLETRLFNYIQYFQERGDEVTVLYSRKAKEIELPETVHEIKVNLGIVPKVFRTWYFSHQLKSIMRRHAFDFSLSLGRTAQQKAVLAPCTHLGYLKALGKKRLSISDRINIHLDREAYAQSQIIYACSKMVKQEMIELYRVPPKKIEILYPPLNTDIYFKKEGESRLQLKQRLGMDTQKTSLLFVSTSHERKGLPLLLKVFERLRQEAFELCVVGLPRVRSKLPNVKYLGYFKDLREYYAAADCTVHPATYEPFGQIISESLQCGTPVLVSAMCGAKEIVDERCGLVIDELSPERWEQVIRSLPERQFSFGPEVFDGHSIRLDEHVERMISLFCNQ